MLTARDCRTKTKMKTRTKAKMKTRPRTMTRDTRTWTTHSTQRFQHTLWKLPQLRWRCCWMPPTSQRKSVWCACNLPRVKSVERSGCPAPTPCAMSALRRWPRQRNPTALSVDQVFCRLQLKVSSAGLTCHLPCRNTAARTRVAKAQRMFQSAQLGIWSRQSFTARHALSWRSPTVVQSVNLTTF